MSNAESIVVSLENAKRLKEAGWPQDDSQMFFWYRTTFNDPQQMFKLIGGHDLTVNSASINFMKDEYDQWFAAPSAEEVLRRLTPERAEGYHHSTPFISWTEIHNRHGGWI